MTKKKATRRGAAPEFMTRIGRLGQAGLLAARLARAGALAAKYNLPADLRPREVALAVALGTAGGPLTRAEWHERAGLRAGVGLARTDGGRRVYALTLERAGLALRVKRAKPKTGARMPDLFLPTPRLLDLLAAAASPPPK